MAIFSCAFMLLGGIIGAGFASGREIVCFFAACGSSAWLAALCAVVTLCLLFLRLCARMDKAGCTSLSALCEKAFRPRFARLCSLLFLILSAATGGAMLAACAELAALTLYLPQAYAVGMLFSLLLGVFLACRSVRGVALSGAMLLLFLPALIGALWDLPAGEARFFQPSARPMRALLSGGCYGALSAATLAGLLPALLVLAPQKRRQAIWLFAALFALLLSGGTLICCRHYAAIAAQPLPFVYLSRELGGGYLLVAACLYAAALSTLCAMLKSLMLFFPGRFSAAKSALSVLLFAFLGFDHLIAAAYPALGLLCAGLLALLCFAPYCQSISSR